MRYSFTYYWNVERDAVGRFLGFMDGYREGHKLQIAYRGFVLMDDSDRRDRFEDLLRAAETLFAIFNDERRRPAGYRGPSMSVGNVIEIQGVCFAVTSPGFERVEIWQSEIVPSDYRWILPADCPEVVR